MLDAGLIAAALAGLTGSVHCLGMCGAYVAAGSSTLARPLVPARDLRIRQVVTQLGRLSTYVLLGAAFGAAGGAAFAVEWPAAQRSLYAVANVVLLFAAARMALPALAAAGVERAGLAVFRQAASFVRPLVAAPHLAGRFAMGMLWGLTPCALIYGLLPVALLSGNAISGAGVMLGLWLGTLPALMLATRFAQRLGAPRHRLVAGLVVAAFACAGLYRALFLPLSGGPFCAVL